MVCGVIFEQRLITHSGDHHTQYRRIESGNGKFHCFHTHGDNQVSMDACAGLGGDAGLGFNHSHIGLACGKRLVECG